VTQDAIIEPGHFVRHPQQPDWGIGQVQSVIDGRITVNFENAGKVLVNARVVSLEVLHEQTRQASRSKWTP
jgi:transcription elongation factor GreA-like protein